MSNPASPAHTGREDLLTWIVRLFLDSKLSIIFIIVSLLIGLAVLLVSPREEDPQIVVPLADIFVNFPGHSAHEVEQLVSTPLERILYQIDGVEYVPGEPGDYHRPFLCRAGSLTQPGETQQTAE